MSWWAAGLLGTFLRIFKKVDDEEEIGTLHFIYAFPGMIFLFAFVMSYILGPVSFVFLLPKKRS